MGFRHDAPNAGEISKTTASFIIETSEPVPTRSTIYGRARHRKP